MDLDFVVFEVRMIESSLLRDMNAVYYVPVWALISIKNQKSSMLDLKTKAVHIYDDRETF